VHLGGASNTVSSTTEEKERDAHAIYNHRYPVVAWVLGFSMQIGGNVIHALLVIALVVFLVNLISGRRAV
jgi:hypothetical protein